MRTMEKINEHNFIEMMKNHWFIGRLAQEHVQETLATEELITRIGTQMQFFLALAELNGIDVDAVRAEVDEQWFADEKDKEGIISAHFQKRTGLSPDEASAERLP